MTIIILICMFVTEWLVFMLFRYPRRKRNVVTFILVNITCLGVMHVPFVDILKPRDPDVIGPPGGAFLGALFLVVILEHLILLVKVVVYGFLLVGEDGLLNGWKNVRYAFFANLAGIIVGIAVNMLKTPWLQ